MQLEAKRSGWFNHKQNPHTSSYESKAMVSTVCCMLVCDRGIIDISLNPSLLFLNNSVDITSVQTIKNCTGFDLSQFSFFTRYKQGDNEQTLSMLV